MYAEILKCYRSLTGELISWRSGGECVVGGDVLLGVTEYFWVPSADRSFELISLNFRLVAR